MDFQTLTIRYQHHIKTLSQLAFNQELQNGHLSRDVFCYYLQQDSHYLIEYGRALAIIGTRVKSVKHMSQFYQFAMSALDSEHSLHQDFLQRFHYQKTHHANTACIDYTHFLLSSAKNEKNVVAIAAVLPCFWAYFEVGKQLQKHSAANNPYQNWIDLYSSPEFATAVTDIANIFNSYCQTLSAETKKQIDNAFATALEYEYRFWTAAYVGVDTALHPAEA